MATTIKASSQGLELVDITRRKKGWTKIDTRLVSIAHVSAATLKRFWARRPITRDAFVGICQAIGVDWQEITESGSGHLQRLLDEGTDAWNQWKRLNPPLGYKLDDANLRNAELGGVDLSNTSLVGVKLDGANLEKANLTNANLTNANLSRANLKGANLTRASLMGADLGQANLENADLIHADLTNANLDSANLRRANLNATQALSTRFTEVVLTGACLQDWNINQGTRLENITCHYIYLKENEQERRPSSREFAPGEFTKLFQKALETVDLIFADGIDWKAFLKSFRELQTQYGEENISVQAIEKKNGGAFVVRLEVPQEVNKAEIERKVKQLYEVEINRLEEIYRERLKAKDDEIEIYRHHNTELLEIIKLKASQQINVKFLPTKNN